MHAYVRVSVHCVCAYKPVCLHASMCVHVSVVSVSQSQYSYITTTDPPLKDTPN